jgi:hypothetical protein
MVVVAVAAAALSAAGCRRSPPPPPTASAAVRAFFAALPAGDCATLRPLLAEDLSCESTVDELRRHGVTLIDVIDERVDARSPDAVIVRARMEQGGRERAEPVLIRAERDGRRWRVRP